MIETMHAALPLLPNRVWRSYIGGKNLDRIEGRENPEDGSYPEDWIGSTTNARNPGQRDEAEGISKVSVEEEGAVSLQRLIADNPEYYLGKEQYKRFGLEMPILAKFLDSAIRLHFQVHPTAEFSRKHLGINKGKTEAYVILDIREEVSEPYIYAGFQRPPTKSQLREWIETQDISAIEGCFDKIPVKVGDVFLIPGGCPHALGEGILMVELMEASDLVVRFEYERAGYVLPEESRFMGKDLDFALSVFDLREKPVESFRCESKKLRSFPDGSVQHLLIGSDRTDCFLARRLRIVNSVTKEESGYYIAVVTNGCGTLVVEGREVQLRRYDRVFIAAGAGRVAFKTEVGMELLELAAPEL